MNTTNINILTLLSQDKFSLDELSLYLNLEKTSIKKDIQNINNFLKYEQFPLILNEDNLYFFQIHKHNWITLINKYNFFTQDEILDYLYIKFIFKRYINLEEERKILDISRSSINRYFKNIKNLLKKNNTLFNSIQGKGIFIQNLSIIDQRIFCKKLMKIFIKSNLTFNKKHLIYTIINKKEIDDLMQYLHITFRFIKISPNYFLVYFFISLYICNSINIKFKVDNKYNYEEYEVLNNFIKNNLNKFSILFQKQLFHFLVSLINGNIEFESNILNNATKIVSNIKSKFQVKDLPHSLEKVLVKKLCFSLFKYENKIIKVKKVILTQIEIKLLNLFDSILKNLNLNLFYNDKLLIVSLIEEIILKNYNYLCKNVLLLFDENTILDNKDLQNKLNKYNLNINIESYLFYTLNPIYYQNKFNLIIYDDFTLDESILVIKNYTFTNILESIKNSVLELYFKNTFLQNNMIK